MGGGQRVVSRPSVRGRQEVHVQEADREDGGRAEKALESQHSAAAGGRGEGMSRQGFQGGSIDRSSGCAMPGYAAIADHRRFVVRAQRRRKEEHSGGYSRTAEDLCALTNLQRVARLV